MHNLVLHRAAMSWKWVAYNRTAIMNIISWTIDVSFQGAFRTVETDRC